VLVLHGFTGSPYSVRGLAVAFADAGFAVELPLLPGHGTSVSDLATTTWADWSATAESAYVDLSGRCRQVVVAGLSMGALLATWLAARHPAVAGLVLVNPFMEPVADSFRDLVRGLLDAGIHEVPAIGSDIARPGVTELAYDETPIQPALSLFDAVDDVVVRLPEVRCPVLLFSSVEDHVAPPAGSDRLAAAVSGPLERVMLTRSYHVATLDYDREEIETRAVAFAREVTGIAG